MPIPRLRTAVVASLLLCAMMPAVLTAADAKPAADPAAAATPPAAGNPLLAPWSGPYGGVPAFDQIKPEHFGPALETALNDARRDRGRSRPIPRRPPSQHRRGAGARRRPLQRVASMFGTWSGSLRTRPSRRWSAIGRPSCRGSRRILLDGPLFARVQSVWDSAEKQKLTAEQQRLLWRTYNNFSRLGAKLGPQEKTRLSAINQELAGLYTAFGQKVLADEETWIVLDSQADLAGLPEGIAAALKAAAEEHQLAGKWAVVNTRSVVDPFLTYSSRRDLREKVWKAFKSRGDNGNANDTNATIAQILPLRAEKAHLLGYPNYAAWKLSNTMAKTPERARTLRRRCGSRPWRG